jgi:hypothetical protein
MTTHSSTLLTLASSVLALSLVACGSSTPVAPDASMSADGGATDANLDRDATIGDGGVTDANLDRDAETTDAGTSSDAATRDAATGDAATGDAAIVGPSPCDGLGAAACFANAACSAVFDDLCCSDCTPGPCADCTNFTYIACRPFAGCREYCGFSPSWACFPTAPDCGDARPVDADSCSRTGCVPAVAPVGSTPIVDTCVAIVGDSCRVTCRRLPPTCPAGTVPEADGFCYTDRCIPAFVCE